MAAEQAAREAEEEAERQAMIEREKEKEKMAKAKEKGAKLFFIFLKSSPMFCSPEYSLHG